MPGPDPAPPDECANCGADIPRTARVCPGCGADERTGWRDNDATRYDGLDLPESAFADESSEKKRSVPHWFWPAVGVLLLLALITTFVFRR